MGIGSGTAALIGGLASAGGSIASGAIGSSAASSAAAQQAAAANNAANLDYQASQNALGFQEGQYNNSQAELAPYLQSGAGALSNLDYLSGISQPSSLSGTAGTTGTVAQPGTQNNIATPGGSVASTAPVATGSLPTASAGNPINVSASPNTSLGGFGSLMQAYPGGQFTAPTAAEAAATPGYQFQLQQGNQLLQQSAAARGNLLTGGTAEALQNYGQGLASTNYQNVYNNALSTYGTNYNTYQQNQANQYNRLAALAGVGQTTAQTLGNLGQSTANSVTNNELGTAQAIGQQGNNAAAANASGIVGGANAWSNALGSTTNNLSNLAMLSQLYGGSSGGGSGGSGIFNADPLGAQNYGMD